MPLILFLATCGSTFFVAASHWEPILTLADPTLALAAIRANWVWGLEYMAAVLGILLAHEMGHYVQALRYRIPARGPYFIPLPIMLTGTMGAVISMQGARADRKQLFDIGVTGPWAGLIVATPVICLGILRATAAPADASVDQLGDPLIFKLLTRLLRPELPADVMLQMNPPLMAGWVAMLVTGLNMMPVSQLDGGHVIYGLFGRRANIVARVFVMGSIATMIITDYYQWVVMLVLVVLLGVDHPPTRDDDVPLGWPRMALGWASLLIPVFCFTPKII